MSNEGLVSTLEKDFHQAVQGHNKTWEQRKADANAFDETFLSISWQGTIRYLAARSYIHQKASAKRAHEQSGSTDSFKDPGVEESLVNFGFEKPERGFFRCLFSCFEEEKELKSSIYQNGPYHFDCTVFYKASHIEPDPLRKLFGLVGNGPTNPVGVVPGFAEIPLNHYYMVCREQPIRLKSPPPKTNITGVLEVSEYSFRSSKEVIDHLMREIFPPNIVKKDTASWFCKFICRLIWKVLFPLLVLIGGVFALYTYYTPFKEYVDAIWQEYNVFEVSDLRNENVQLQEENDHLVAELSSLTGQYNELIETRDQIAESESPAALDPARAGLDAQIVEIEREINQRAGELSVYERRTGLDMPPCWERYSPSGRRIPIYILEIYIGDSGLELSLPDAARARAESEGLDLSSMPIGQALTVDEFNTAAIPIYLASRAQECRHFVILREGEHSTADAYRAHRDAVERYFYIFRP